MTLCDKGYNEALERALLLLKYRKRSESELTRRLRKLGFSEGVAKEVSGRLKEDGLIDDEDFAFSFMEELLRKGYGKLRITKELYRKGLSKETVEIVMASYPHEDEEDRALEQAVRKYERFKGDASIKRKLYSFLIRKGYSSEIARQTISRCLVDTEETQE